MIGRTISHYRIVEPLGRGGMGVVYKAEDTRLGRWVALKFLPDELIRERPAMDRFAREARAISALNHPHICTIYDIGEDGGRPFLVLEFVEGETLGAHGGRPLAAAEVVRLGLQIAHALAAAHARGIVHRDLKPANILVTREGAAKLLDFGIAKLATGPSGIVSTSSLTWGRTQPGMALGTPAYMSPEQVRGEQVDERTDIFSLGVVLYELATGRSPFTGATSALVWNEILMKEPPEPSLVNRTVDRELERIIMKALAKTPAARYQSAAYLRNDLERLDATLAAAAPVRSSSRSAEQASIVVLPFENLSPDPENAFFSEGLTDELIADLSKVSALRVISRTSAMALKGTNKDVRTIARELDVRYLVEGSVRRAGNAVRITAQLVDAPNDTHLWAEKYTGTLEDVFDLQERLSRRIVEALKVTLTADEDRRLAVKQFPDVRALDCYLRAQRELHQLTPTSLDRAFELTNEALAIAGPNPLLYATLGQVHFLWNEFGVRREAELLALAGEWASRALELDCECAPAFMVQGMLAWRRGDMGAAIRGLRSAVDHGGDGPAHAWLAYFCFQTARVAEAEAAAERAFSLDPLNSVGRISRALVAVTQKEFEGAAARLRGVADVAGYELVKAWLGFLALYAGHEREARDAFAELAAGDAGILSAVGAVLGPAIRRDAAGVDRALANNPQLTDFAREDKEISLWLAEAFACLGRVDDALRWIENSIERGFCNERFWSVIPTMAWLREDPRFAKLMRRAIELSDKVDA
jgi:serine/threonine protein kinase